MAHFEDSFQRELWQAIRVRAAQRGVSTVAYLGHGLWSTDPSQATSNIVYSMAGAPVVDGLIVFSNNLGTFTGPGAVAELILARGLPAVSIGFELTGVPSVRVSGGPALATVVDHLAGVHQRRRFALVTGPSDHPESADREAAVRATLALRGLDLDPRMVFDGGFSRERGREVAEALTGSGRGFDAVVCLNDHMAVGVIEALRERGLRIPEDVSVTGFDDLAESRWRKPPLTTVRQPVDDMGSQAVDFVLDRWAGKPGAAAVFDGVPTFRQSCGCLPSETAPLMTSTLLREVEESLERTDRFARIRELGVRLLGTFRRETLARQWQETLEALGLVEGSLVLFEGTTGARSGVPDQARTLCWSKEQGLQTEVFPTSQLFPPGPLPRLPDRADWLVLPLVYRDEPLGYLILRCTAEDALVYETLRDQVSTAVKATLLMEASRNHEDVLERTVEERTRDLRDQVRQRQLLEREVQEISHRTMQAIGQDIHDDLCQHLAGISMLVSVLEEKTPKKDRGPVREIADLLEQAVGRAKQYARSLYPPGLEEHGLVPALQDLIESLQKTSGGVTISLQTDADLGIADHRIALQLYRIIQESLGNAIRHSGGDLVILKITKTDGYLEAEVRDFGRGIEPPVSGKSMGLKIMRYRAEAIGARLELRRLDPGLCVSCVLPLSGGSRG